MKKISIILLSAVFAVNAWAGAKLSSVSAKVEAGSNALTFNFADTIKKGPIGPNQSISLNASELKILSSKAGGISISDGSHTMDCNGGQVFDFKKTKSIKVSGKLTGSQWSYSGSCSVSTKG